MSAAVTYYAIKPIMVGGAMREPGDLIPEANFWPGITQYVNDNRIASVLVATLPKATRDALAEWELEQEIAAEDAALVSVDEEPQEADPANVDADAETKEEVTV